MKAELQPLDGKYYGTKITILDDNGFDYQITLWNCGNYEPSHRELRGHCTIDQWRANEVIDSVDPFYQNGTHAKDVVEIRDSHFESRETYALAKKLVSLINGAK